jgi:glycosyltransferase involved in cell wall biosynthesis
LEKVWDWCDVLVLPTLSENFGRVVAEALERGKRVITTDGAPAWESLVVSDQSLVISDQELGVRGQELGVCVGYNGRLLYLKGYRDGVAEKRIELLKNAILVLSRDKMILSSKGV